MDYIAIKVFTSPEWCDIIMAELAEYPVDMFDEHEEGITGYIKSADYEPSGIKDCLDGLHAQYPCRVELQHIEGQNWNEVWESNFEPVRIGNFVNIRAEHHPPVTDVRFDLLVQPKMAFGTGHHETTHLVTSLMEAIDFEGKTVFDYGCGTGILAIIAAKLGAAHADAVDIEVPSYESTIENCAVNQVSNVTAFLGDIHAVPVRTYDVILANINRNVILASLPDLVARCQSGTIILFSGFLRADEPVMIEAFGAHGLRHVVTEQRGQWLVVKTVFEG